MKCNIVENITLCPLSKTKALHSLSSFGISAFTIKYFIIKMIILKYFISRFIFILILIFCQPFGRTIRNNMLGDLGLDIYVILFCAAFCAGFIDSIAGGGGMITIPALFLAGIPPHQALGVNKLQSCFGSFSATMHFYKKGHIVLKDNITPVICVFLSLNLLTCYSLSFFYKLIVSQHIG